MLPRSVLLVRFEEVSVVFVTLGVVFAEIEVNIPDWVSVEAIIVVMVIVVSGDRVRMCVSRMIVEVTGG